MLVNTGKLICLACLLIFSSFKPLSPTESTFASCSKAKPKTDFSYTVKYKEPTFKNLRMIGRMGKCGIDGDNKTTILYGGILRALRFQNITEKAEEKYGLPKNLLLAMIMQESHGADLLPNCLDDGGIGLCHMQGSTATTFGLKTYKGFNKLRSKVHGQALRKLIKLHKYDRKKLIKYDDRFHPILNIDAAGRMLCYYTRNGKRRGLTTVQTGVFYYAGSYNYQKYWRNVDYYRKKLNDENVIKAVERRFNAQNKTLLINGKKGDFKGYIKAHQEQNFNYGLGKYN